MTPRLRRTLFGFFSFIAILFTATAFAQVLTSTSPSPLLGPPPSPDDIFSAGQKVYSDWRSAGALAAAVTLVKLFVDITKFQFIEDWLGEHHWKWVRPVAALLLGGIGSVLAATQLHTNLVIAFVHGILAGASAIGVNELAGMMGAVKEAKAASDAAKETP